MPKNERQLAVDMKCESQRFTDFLLELLDDEKMELPANVDLENPLDVLDHAHLLPRSQQKKWHELLLGASRRLGLDTAAFSIGVTVGVSAAEEVGNRKVQRVLEAWRKSNVELGDALAEGVEHETYKG